MWERAKSGRETGNQFGVALALLYCLVLLPPPLCKAEERPHLTAMIQGTLKSLELEWKAELECLLLMLKLIILNSLIPVGLVSHQDARNTKRGR